MSPHANIATTPTAASKSGRRLGTEVVAAMDRECLYPYDTRMPHKGTQRTEETSGYVYVATGSMFSGKSSRLIHLALILNIRFDAKCLVIKYANDNRYGGELTMMWSHGALGCKARPVKCDELMSLVDVIDREGYDAVLVDEFQFFKDGVEFVQAVARKQGRFVAVAGLDLTFEKKDFPVMRDVIRDHSDTTDVFRAHCEFCKGKNRALYSFRKVADRRLELIGGADMYAPACEQCFEEQLEQQQQEQEQMDIASETMSM
jgi:thymidine kinase